MLISIMAFASFAPKDVGKRHQI